MLAAHPRLRLAVVHGGLFLATCLTTTFSAYAWAMGGPLRAGLPYAGTLLGILLAHEMGHYIMGRRLGVQVSLPYFIPLPLLGTLGAVIRMPPVRSRDALVAIGAAGPLAGLVIAVPLLVVGLHLSDVGPIPPVSEQEGNSILYLAIKWMVKGALLPAAGRDVSLHPVAYGAWVGLLVTMINLMPIGQLDGGHISYGYFGARYDRASALFHRALVLIGLLVMGFVGQDVWRGRPVVAEALTAGARAALPWFLWSFVIEILRRLTGGEYHPPVSAEPLGPRGRFLAYVVVVVFVLIFVPIPMRASVP